MNRPRRRLLSRGSLPAISILAVMLVVFSSARAATPEQVDAAVDKAVKHLYAIQKNGIWELDPNSAPGATVASDGMHHGGLTAIAVFALLAAGENPRDPKLVKAIDFLKKLNTQSVYVLGIRAQIWPYLGDTPDVKGLLSQDARLILGQIKTDGMARGLFYYPLGKPQQYDHSISQFGVLGLWTAIQNDIEIPSGVWDTMDQAWRAHQQPDGGWPYIVGRPGEEGEATLSMTCAGVATLFITHDYAHAARERTCNGNPVDENIERGVKWIADNFDRCINQVKGRDNNVLYYAFYALERVGVAGGYKRFGTINWFETGAEFIVKHQNPDGSWGRPADVFGINFQNVPDTSFAMLFLIHGRAPTVINKLSYGEAAGVKPSWNQRPRDIANLVRWTGRRTEHPLQWHIVTLDAPMAELHEAPILYLAGSKAVAFNENDTAKLRQFVEEGGMLVAHADCGGGEFSKSIQKLGSALFPDYEFRDLPMSHPIFMTQQYTAKKFKSPPKLKGLSNGVRELIVLISEGDPARQWQVPFQGNLSPYALGTDIIEYSSDRQGLAKRIPSPVIEPDGSIHPTRSIKLARISYAANWNPEPGGWRRLSALLHNTYKLGLDIETVKLGEGKLHGHTLAHMTGTTAFTLNDAQRKELKAFVDGGGTLIVDAAGGSTEFADSAEKEFPAIFGTGGKSPGDPLPPNNPLYHQPNAKIDAFHYRAFARVASRGNGPRLIAVQQNGRGVAYYSSEDLSGGLVGEEVDGIVGYTPETATAIMRNIVLQASGGQR